MAGQQSGPVHGTIEPVDRDRELDGHELYGFEIGRSWTYGFEDQPKRIRRVVEPGGTLLASALPRGEGAEWVNYELLDGGLSREVSRVAYSFDLDGIERVAEHFGPTDTKPEATFILPEPRLEFPWKVTALSGPEGPDPSRSRLVGFADVSVPAGSWKRCAVIDTWQPTSDPETDTPRARRFFCPKVGLALLELADAQGRWGQRELLLETTATSGVTATPKKAPAHP